MHSKTTTILFKLFGVERAWEYLGHARLARPRQLFVTKSSLLAKKVEQEFIAFIKYDTMTENAPRHFVQRVARAEDVDSDALFTSEDLGEWRTGLPLRYSELTDEHFPLFLTYDEVFSMLKQHGIKSSDRIGFYSFVLCWRTISRPRTSCVKVKELHGTAIPAMTRTT